MKNRYPVKLDNENMGCAKGSSMGISTKQSIEIASWIRNLGVIQAKKRLQEVVDMKRAVPMTRFNKDVGHKKKIGPGRYPIKSATQILKIIESAESNAVDKGLNSKDLFIYHISAHKDAQQWRYGRHRRRKAKRTNLYIVLKTKEAVNTTKKAETEKKSEQKPEIKKEPQTKTIAKETKVEKKEVKPKEKVIEEKKVEVSQTKESVKKEKTIQDDKKDLKQEVKEEKKEAVQKNDKK